MYVKEDDVTGSYLERSQLLAAVNAAAIIKPLMFYRFFRRSNLNPVSLPIILSKIFGMVHRYIPGLILKEMFGFGA